MNAELLLQEFETKEEKKKLDDWIKEFKLKEQKQNEKIKELISDTSYLEWLISYTNKYGSFCDEDIFSLYGDETDKTNIGHLYLFFRGIKDYADENFIYPTPTEYGEYYKVRLNYECFKIGVSIGQGTIFYVDKSVIENKNEFIDFIDIMNNKKQPNVDEINERLNLLSSRFIETYESGVPIEVILNRLDDVAKKILEKEEDKAKKLTKTCN